MISALSCSPPSTGCRSPKIGQHDKETPKTWSRANIYANDWLQSYESQDFVTVNCQLTSWLTYSQSLVSYYLTYSQPPISWHLTSHWSLWPRLTSWYLWPSTSPSVYLNFDFPIGHFNLIIDHRLHLSCKSPHNPIDPPQLDSRMSVLSLKKKITNQQ
jgi:hypothetical protein